MSRAREFVYLVIGTCFGLGLLPVAPGSFGALIGVAFHVALVRYTAPPWHLPALIGGLAAVIAANHWLTPWAVKYWNDEDPGHFVLDEVAGYLVVPILFRGGELWQVALYGFVLFRVLDIIKIPPARQIDRDVHGPWGIVLDDLISGAYAALVLYGLLGLGLISP